MTSIGPPVAGRSLHDLLSHVSRSVDDSERERKADRAMMSEHERQLHEQMKLDVARRLGDIEGERDPRRFVKAASSGPQKPVEPQKKELEGEEEALLSREAIASGSVPVTYDALEQRKRMMVQFVQLERQVALMRLRLKRARKHLGKGDEQKLRDGIRDGLEDIASGSDGTKSASGDGMNQDLKDVHTGMRRLRLLEDEYARYRRQLFPNPQSGVEVALPPELSSKPTKQGELGSMDGRVRRLEQYLEREQFVRNQRMKMIEDVRRLLKIHREKSMEDAKKDGISVRLIENLIKDRDDVAQQARLLQQVSSVLEESKEGEEIAQIHSQLSTEVSKRVRGSMRDLKGSDEDAGRRRRMKGSADGDDGDDDTIFAERESASSVASGLLPVRPSSKSVDEEIIRDDTKGKYAEPSMMIRRDKDMDGGERIQKIDSERGDRASGRPSGGGKKLEDWERDLYTSKTKSLRDGRKKESEETSNDAIDAKPIERWLTSLGLSEYVSAFVENEVDSSCLPLLYEEDLIEMGVRRVGHRTMIMSSIQQAMAMQDIVEHTNTRQQVAKEGRGGEDGGRATTPEPIDTLLLPTDQDSQLLDQHMIDEILSQRRSGVTAVLQNIGLGRYQHTLETNDVDMRVFLYLTSSDLVSMGISAVGPRRKLLTAIERLRSSKVHEKDTVGAETASSRRGSKRDVRSEPSRGSRGSDGKGKSGCSVM